MARDKYRYRVTGPKGGKYLTTTRAEAEKLTRNGGSFRVIGQRKASKVSNPHKEQECPGCGGWGHDGTCGWCGGSGTVPPRSEAYRFYEWAHGLSNVDLYHYWAQALDVRHQSPRNLAKWKALSAEVERRKKNKRRAKNPGHGGLAKILKRRNPDLSNIPTETLASYMDMLQQSHGVNRDAYTAQEREGAKIIGNELRSRGYDDLPAFARR